MLSAREWRPSAVSLLQFRHNGEFPTRAVFLKCVRKIHIVGKNVSARYAANECMAFYHRCLKSGWYRGLFVPFSLVRARLRGTFVFYENGGFIDERKVRKAQGGGNPPD